LTNKGLTYVQSWFPFTATHATNTGKYATHAADGTAKTQR